jgi:hypothetical protein
VKVIIPTKNRPDLISTHRVPAFANADVHILVHTASQMTAYLDAAKQRGDDPYGFAKKLVITNTEPDTFGLTRQREWACKNLVPNGEWFVFADDNIVDLQGPDQMHRTSSSLPVQEAKHWRDVFAHSINPDEWRYVFASDTREAERINARLVGFATTGNHFFRGKKWRPVGYVIGKMMLWRNDPYRWDHTISMEDFRHTAEHLLRHGAVLIDNFVWPKCEHYQHGGMGTYVERIPQRTQDVGRLMQVYPGIFRVKNRKGFAPNTDLAIRFNSVKQVQQWRDAMRPQR